MAAAAQRVGATFQRQSRNLVKLVRTFVGLANRAAIMAGQNPDFRSYSIFNDLFQSGSMGGCFFFKFALIRGARRILLDHPFPLQFA
jgi:hypothetical protein